MKIQFTQFLRPNGEPRSMFIDVPDDLALRARGLAQRGVRFEIEVLLTGDVFMTAELTEKVGVSLEDHVLSNRLCPNGPRVPEMVRELVEDAEIAFSSAITEAP